LSIAAWMIAVSALISQTQGTPYISGGDSPAGTDCSGLASWVANIASGRPTFGDRFSTRNEGAELSERGFIPGTSPGALVIGWNSYHTAVTLPDGTPVASGERGGVHVGGAGAYQRQFSQHMYLPVGELPPPPVAGPSPAALSPAGPAPTDTSLPPPPGGW